MSKRCVVAALALFLVASAFAADLPPGKWWRRPEIAQNLGLTTEQQDKLENIWRSASTELIDFRGDVEKANIALRAELDRPQLDRRAVQSAAAKLSAARARLFERELMMLVDMRSVLTDAQWTKMRTFLDRVEANRAQQQRQPQPRRQQ